jgi:hypothetical protein
MKEQIIEQAISYFGKDRKRLKETVISFKLDGSEYRRWKQQIKQITDHPSELSYGIFDDVVEWLKEKNYSEIDWHWIGDLSWQFQILLNQNVEKGYDWDKKLAIKCGGTARILRIYVSDIVPCFAMDVYYMTYDRKENYYEFGPLKELTPHERKLIHKAKQFFQKSGFTFLARKAALKRHPKLYSDCNSEGNARLFDALFSDTRNYQQEIKRFNAEQLKDPTGKNINWDEYYNQKGELERREEFRYYPSNNVECVITDGLGQIIKVKIWRDTEEMKHQEFVLDVVKIQKRKKRRQSDSHGKRNVRA